MPSTHLVSLDRPERTATAPIGMQIDRAIFARLRPAAVKRDVSVVELIQKLLVVIAADQLVDAVLDDDQ
jgi:hypothetical protein